MMGGLEADLELARSLLKYSVLIGYFQTNSSLAAERNIAALSQLPITTAITNFKTSESGVRWQTLYFTNNKMPITCETAVYVLKNR